MAWDVRELVGPEGWTTRQEPLRRVDRGTVDTWVAAGRLVRLPPGVFATPTAARDWQTGVAALARARPAMVSHGTALALWDLMPPAGGPVHLTIAPTRSARGSTSVVLHRAPDVDEVTRRVSGLLVTCVERAVVDAWALSGETGVRGCRAGRSSPTWFVC